MTQIHAVIIAVWITDFTVITCDLVRSWTSYESIIDANCKKIRKNWKVHWTPQHDLVCLMLRPIYPRMKLFRYDIEQCDVGRLFVIHFSRFTADKCGVPPAACIISENKKKMFLAELCEARIFWVLYVQCVILTHVVLNYLNNVAKLNTCLC